MSWVDVGPLSGLTPRGARVVRVGGVDIAVFRSGGGDVFALRDSCPHRGGPLSQGIVHGERVTCPLHDWIIDLKSGQATGVDVGCTPTFATRVDGDRVYLEVPDALAASAATPAVAAPATIRGGVPHAGSCAAPETRVYAVFEPA